MGDKRHHIVSAEQAIQAINKGDLVFIEGACGAPEILIDALIEQKERLKGTHLFDCMIIPGSRYADLTDFFQIITVYVNTDLRAGVANGTVDFLPITLKQIPRLFTTTLPMDVALVHVSMPDERGFCSFGASTGFNRDAALASRVVIAQVNDQMPYTYGDNLIHVSDLDYVVEVSQPIKPWQVPKIRMEEEAVAKVVSERIDNGDTICIGVGAVPDAVVRMLTDRRHLGIHSGMISDSTVDLMQRGVVTNERKAINQGRTVSGAAAGTDKIFQFIHKNPQVEMYPYTYTHDGNIISQIDNFVAIVSAIEVDLSGQVNAETIGGLQISAVGGQADWLRGAAIAPRGRSIIAFTSVMHGKSSYYSRIIPHLREGTITSVPRYDVDCVATEFGFADLKGKTLSQRAKALISIAHPDFREELEKYKQQRD